MLATSASGLVPSSLAATTSCVAASNTRCQACSGSGWQP